jgi:hypothetical protein
MNEYERLLFDLFPQLINTCVFSTIMLIVLLFFISE